MIPAVTSVLVADTVKKFRYLNNARVCYYDD